MNKARPQDYIDKFQRDVTNELLRLRTRWPAVKHQVSYLYLVEDSGILQWLWTEKFEFNVISMRQERIPKYEAWGWVILCS